LRADGGAEREERAARLSVSQAASRALRSALPALKRAEEIAFAERLIADYETKMHRHAANGSRRIELETLAETERRLRLAALEAERAELLALRDSEVINEHTLREIEAEIDHAEMLIVGVARVGHG
jgi:phage terminase Nu1 subunit (DNA packaging protein)